MDVQDLIEFARQQWNAVNDAFFSDDELYRMVWAASTDLAVKTKCIRDTFTTSTVAYQQEYARPTYAIGIKRITYEGGKLFKITDREDDSLTLGNQTTVSYGTPQYYWEWGSTILLRAVPAEVGTLKIYSYNIPQEVSSSSTLEIPAAYHLKMTDFLLWKMAVKDKNFDAARAYKDIWDGHVKDVKDAEKMLLRGDAFAAVQDMETLPLTVIGAL